MKILAISDLHGSLPAIPECDLLLLGGDYELSKYMNPGYRDEFRRWLNALPAKEIVAVAGNHDFDLESGSWGHADGFQWHLLQDSGVELFGLKIWGTPWTPTFFNWAFMKDDPDLLPIFEHIPLGLDILISHGPPYQVCDRNYQGEHCGSKSLRSALHNVQPKVVICGHIHEARGYHELGPTAVYNVSHFGRGNRPCHPPVQIYDDFSS